MKNVIDMLFCDWNSEFDCISLIIVNYKKFRTFAIM